MKATATPALRLTASSIWSSFRSSGKRHIVITGGRGAGKSTLLSRLFPEADPLVQTYAEPKKAVFLKESLLGKTAIIGIYDDTLPGNENKMRPVESGFSEIGVNALKKGSELSSEWALIDEIGYLEANNAEYCQAILELMEKKRVAAVVRKQELPFLRALCSREDVFCVDIDNPFGNIACVIMASGVGKRFGGNKLMADFGGRPLICSVLDSTENIFSQRVVVTRHADIAALCLEMGIENVLHSFPERNDTVRLGIDAVKSAEACMFCQADQPLLKKDTVAALALAAKNGSGFIWRTSHEGAPGAPVVFPSSFFGGLLTLPKGKGGGFLIKQFPSLVRSLSVADKFELMDVDTSEDLKKLTDR